MTKKTKNFRIIKVLSCLFVLLCVTGDLWAGDPPKPGTVIDQGNYMQYKEFFPEEWLEAFTTGWGLINPISIKVSETKPNPIPKAFLEATAKNKGKYGLDSEGYITGGPEAEIFGFPFPDVSPKDQKYALKFMWNFSYRYQYDTIYGTFLNYQKRRGERLTTSLVDGSNLFYQGRVHLDPKPNYNTRTGWRNAILIRILTPPSTRNLINLLVKYKDQKEPDLTYVYLPTLRRVLRGEAGQRSTPIASSTQAPDDFGGFDGRIAEFNYTIVGEQKILAQFHDTMTYTSYKDRSFEFLPMDPEGWELRDTYVIDIIPKDLKYAQGRKRIWVDKENYQIPYTVAWDRAGALWKIWYTHTGCHKTPYGETVAYSNGMLGMDIQLGYGAQMAVDWTFNTKNIQESDTDVAAMRRMAR